MANPKDDPRLLLIDKFGGLNTNAVRGAHTQPNFLENVYLEHAGGYSAQYALSPQILNVMAALSAGMGNDLFVTQADGTHYARFGTSLGPVIWNGSVANAIKVMPQLLLSNDGATFINSTGTVPALLPAPTVGQANTFQLEWAYSTETSATGYSSATAYDHLLIFEYGGTATFTAGSGVGSPPTFWGLTFLWHAPTIQGPVAVYRRPSGATGSAWTLASAFNKATATVNISGDYSSPVNPPQRNTPGGAATYHQGRVYMNGIADATVVQGATYGTVTANQPNRVWYSSVIASSSGGARPRWNPLSYIDVPFKVSYQVVSLISIGAYLYIFGDRELYLLTGDPGNASLYGGGRLESIGDGVGAIAPNSIQLLGNTAYYLSSSGINGVRGGQTKEISSDVSDVVFGLNSSNISSTCDYIWDIYLITDGVTTLVYHPEEDGWSIRNQAQSGKLITGGGMAYALNGSTLNSMGGEISAVTLARPAKLTYTAEWGPFECGDWLLRKNFHHLMCGIDLTAMGSAVVTNMSTVNSNSQLNLAQTITSPTNRVAFHLSQGGIPQSGVTVTVRLSVNSQDSRAYLRAPLVVNGAAGPEETMPV